MRLRVAVSDYLDDVIGGAGSPTRIARASRVYSSTMLQSLILRRSEAPRFESWWTAHTSFALEAPQGAASALLVAVTPLPRFSGRLSPSLGARRGCPLAVASTPLAAGSDALSSIPHCGCSTAISRTALPAIRRRPGDHRVGTAGLLPHETLTARSYIEPAARERTRSSSPSTSASRSRSSSRFTSSGCIAPN